MLRTVVVRGLTAQRSVRTNPTLFGSNRKFSDAKDEAPPAVDATLLELLVCPLSKKPLRFDAKTNELINDELGIAYPVIDGIPNMIPQEARLLHQDPDVSTAPTQG